MAKIAFTAHLRKVAPPGVSDVAAETLGDALDHIFRQAPKLKSYVVDEQNRLRRHVVIFHNGVRMAPLHWAERRIGAEDEIYVMQALSGG